VIESLFINLYKNSMNIYPYFKYFAFKADPENIHEKSMHLFNKFPNIYKIFPIPAHNPSKYSLNDGHMSWDFPIGLAAGFDKNAQAIDFFSQVGFGSVEVGTVTPKPQTGNDRPRIWRYPDTNTIRNAMGFPNAGSHEILKNIKSSRKRNCLGVNLGKNKLTSLADTPKEYAFLYEYFVDVADYLVINISSPNTPGLRDLQTKEAFRDICQAIDEKRKLNKKPLYLKISPDLGDESINDMIDLAKEFKLSGIIATNTTTQHSFDKGGLSGDYIKEISSSIRKKVCDAAREEKSLSVIGVGGISSFDEVLEFWKQGGSFTQIYSSFIFHGPKLLQDIQLDLDRYLHKTGHKNVMSLINELKD
jgi:dihydroorotate dehydrogenase